MRFEQDLVGRLPVPLDGRRVPSTEARRDVRVATDALIHEAINANTLPPLLTLSADVMLTLATQLNRHALEPSVEHFIEAARALIEDARTIFDAGMRVDDTDKALVGAVMIELTIRGMFHALSSAEKPLDYDEILKQRYGATNGRSATNPPSGGPGVDSGDPEPDPPVRVA